MLNFNFTDDAKTVTREDVLGSSAVDNAPLKNPLSYDNGFLSGALSTALEPKTSSRVTVLASSVKLKLSTTQLFYLIV